MISYYDIRAARTAMRALQNKPLRRRKLDIHFSIPKVYSRHLTTSSFLFITINGFYLILCYCILLLIPHQDNPSDKDINQGTLVVFNLDPSVSNEDLRQIFGAYGEVKEVINFSFYCSFASFSDLHFFCNIWLTLVQCDIVVQKQIRETPHKRHHKFIEFYDVRAAEAALKSLNRSDIAGKRIKLEPSRPGGARRK